MAERLPVRIVHVTNVQLLTPRMVRISFGGEDLHDFGYDEPDQQVKLYFPKPGQAVPRLPEPDHDFMRWYDAFNAIPEPERPWTRSYTIRAHDQSQRTIDIDFVLHHDPASAPDNKVGPATRWAHRAKPGDRLGMFGPSADFTRPVPLRTSITNADWLLLAGDETALPAIGGILESLPAKTKVLAYVEVLDPAEEQNLATMADLTVHWIHRSTTSTAYGERLVNAVRNAKFPAGSAFAWLAGEASTVRTLRRHLVEERGIVKPAIEFTGHWRLERSQDDSPTDDDIADAREQLASNANHSSTTSNTFDEAYESHTAPWVTGEPQPAIVELERLGRIHGSVLDAGCGTGDHTIYLTELGYDVIGIDSSETAIAHARLNALQHEVAARFEVADALDLADRSNYDTVLDSGLFHNLDADGRSRYVRTLYQACRSGGTVIILAMSDAGPGYGPQISDRVIRDAFGESWSIEEIRESTFRGVLGANGELGDLPAWLATIRRL